MDSKFYSILNFISPDNQQIVVPIYQRSYSWEKINCELLWKDIKELYDEYEIRKDLHFMGSFVVVKHVDDYQEITKFLVIDGQQRITTIIIFILALIEVTNSSIRKKQWKESYIINRHKLGELRYKILLTSQDRGNMNALIDGIHNHDYKNSRIKKNYDYFKQMLKGLDVERVYKVVLKFQSAVVELSPKDNAQRIFESLNSTGVGLLQTDLIMNYILMNLEEKEQERIYNNYWKPMKELVGEDIEKFLHTYIMAVLNLHYIKEKGDDSDIYRFFKKYMASKGEGKREEVLQELYTYAHYYVRLVHGKEKCPQLKENFDKIIRLKTVVAFPIILNMYRDYDSLFMDKQDFIKATKEIFGYVLRNLIWRGNLQGLYVVFPHIYRNIEKNKYLESLRWLIMSQKGKQQMPSDYMIGKQLEEKNMYVNAGKLCRFLLDEYESSFREHVAVEKLKIEHIMPQTLTPNWKKNLGEDWYNLHNIYLHTIGNLTLTAFNSELSNKTFQEKRDMKGGYRESVLRLNDMVGDCMVWGKEEIIKRTGEISKKICELYPYPRVSENYRKEKETLENMEEQAYIENFYKDYSVEIGYMFEEIRKKIMSIHPNIEELINKNHISYYFHGSFLMGISATSKKVTVYMLVDSSKLDDPEGLCEDISTIKGAMSGNVRINFLSESYLVEGFKILDQVMNKVLDDL